MKDIEDNEQKTLEEDIAHSTDQWGFRVRWKYLSHWADCEVFEYVGEECTDPPRIFFNRKDWSSSPDPVFIIDEAELYLSGFIKWDGCSEFEFSRIHWCGPHDYLKHFRLLEALYKRAQELMTSGNDDPWPMPARP